jgi:glycine C-acetyltransferase
MLSLARRCASYGLRPARALSTLSDIAAMNVQAVRDAGTFKTERVITSPQSSSIHVGTSTAEVLNFCANNYLGLANNPEIVEAAHEALRTHGFGLASVRYEQIFAHS